MPHRTIPTAAAPLQRTALTLACAAALVTLCAGPAAAQSSGTASRQTATMPAAGGGNARAMVKGDDLDMMQDLAEANHAEIATGKLALEKSQNPAIKKFAQQMVDDHTKALGELQQLAGKKGVELPKDPDFAHEALAAAMKALSGDTFDNRYIRHAGVGDHRRTVDLLQKIQRTGRDADFKMLATKTLPTVQHHLTMARQLADQKK